MHYLHAYMYMPISSLEKEGERVGREICDSDHLASYTTTMWRYERHIDAYSAYSYVTKQQIW